MKKIITIVLFLSLISLVSVMAAGNKDKPLKGNWNLNMKKTWQVSTAGEDIFGAVQNIVTGNGRVYILDEKNLRIYIFNNSGRFISSFGRQGEGPGEIRNFGMGQQLFVVDKTLIYADRGVLHYFTPDGKYIKSIRFPTSLKPGTFVSPEQFISAPPTMGFAKSRKAEILLYDAKSQTKKIIAEFTPFDKAYTSSNDGKRKVSVGIVIGDITPIMITAFRDGNLYYGMSDVYKINKTPLTGNGTLTFSIPGRSPQPVSKAYKNELKMSMGDIRPDMLKRIMDGLPDKASFFQDIKIAENGMIYVFVSNPNNQSGQDIDIFSPQGKYIYSSSIKIASHLSIYTLYFGDSQLVMAVEDEDEGEMMVINYSIELPDS